MTQSFAIKNHRKMWNWIAKNLPDFYTEGMIPDECKQKYFLAHNFPYPEHFCFCCEYALCITHDITDICDCCPINFSEIEIPDFYSEEYLTPCMKGYYGKFVMACLDGNLKEAITTARAIANLPERSV